MVGWEQFEVLLKRVSLVAGAVIASAGALAVLAGLWRFVGPMAAVGLVGCLAGVFVAWSVPRIARRVDDVLVAVEDVRYHLAPNGHDDRLPEHLRGRPVRQLLVDFHDRFEEGRQWMHDHEGRSAEDAHGGLI